MWGPGRMVRQMAVALGPLQSLSLAELRCVASGYASTQQYSVRTTGTADGGLRWELDLVHVSPPYTKTFRHSEADVALLGEIVARGCSTGAWAGERLVAIAIAEPMAWNRNLVLWEMHVAEGYRRQGLGRALLDSVLEVARGCGVRSVTAETQNTNVPAIRFYRASGFTIQGIDLSLYAPDDAGKDREVALFMRRFL